MPLTNGTGNSKKRRHLEEDMGEPDLHTNAGLQMLTDEEGEDASSDDGEVEEFPEIATDSESDSAEDENGAEETDGESDADSDRSLGIFPKAKTVVSGITKQPKLVYPEIEPEYDSDSSTEDVSDALPNLFPLP